MAVDWGSVATWAGATVATGALGIAVRQLWVASTAQRNQVHIAQANLILSIDAQFEGAEMGKSRKAIRVLRFRAEAKVNGAVQKNKSPESLKDRICEECSHELDQLWSEVKESIGNVAAEDKAGTQAPSATDRYSELMRLPYWFETVGMLCQKGLLPTKDVLYLYDQVVVTTMSAFANHISARQTEGPYVNRQFLENATWLYGQAHKHKEQRDNPPKKRAIFSRLPWL